MHPKTLVQFPAAAASILLAWGLKTLAHVDEPVEVVAAQTALIAFVASSLVPVAAPAG